MPISACGRLDEGRVHMKRPQINASVNDERVVAFLNMQTIFYLVLMYTETPKSRWIGRGMCACVGTNDANICMMLATGLVRRTLKQTLLTRRFFKPGQGARLCSCKDLASQNQSLSKCKTKSNKKLALLIHARRWVEDGSTGRHVSPQLCSPKPIQTT